MSEIPEGTAISLGAPGSPARGSPSGRGGGSRPGRSTRLRGPSRTSSVISSPAVGGQAVEHEGLGGVAEQPRVQLVGLELRAARVGFVLLAHAGPDVGVDEVCAAHRLARVLGPARAARRCAPRARSAAWRTRSAGRWDSGVARRSSTPEQRRARSAASWPRCCRRRRRPRPRARGRRAPRIVSRSAIAWHGWARSVSPLITGIDAARGQLLDQVRGSRSAPRSRRPSARG